ncbi:MAG: polysaccharide biosynthesis protein [Chromatiales bacterium]|nr:polysaccharide biosynthesis protein [Chromatiales bacterium]
MIPLAWLVAYWLHYNLGAIPAGMHAVIWRDLIVVVPIQAAVFWVFGLYRGVWRFASLPDLARISKAVVVGLLLSLTATFLVFQLQNVPRSIPVLYGILLVGSLTTPRFIYRWVKDHRYRFRSARRVMIVGAGQAGEMLARDLLRTRQQAYQPVVFVDDDRQKWGKEIQGIRVAGGCGLMPKVADELGIDLVMLALPSAQPAEIRRVVELAESCGLPFKTVPHMDDLVTGQVSVRELRKVQIEDLLGREPVSLDWPKIRSGLTGKVILVTGAGGSIGSELCQQIADLEPAALVLYEQSEFNLYSVELSLRERFPNLSLHAHLGDITDRVATERVFEKYCPQVVFHAAAYKHVPMLENQTREAVRNNVLGTKVVADAATQYGCSEFVLISTDKAVNPANVMGATKRVAEIYCQNLNANSETRFITVRFGNVLGSAGSVVPLFQRQINLGGPVTVTHPEMERYFMTVREACQLIMQAGVLGEGGEIFVLDMGKPVKINYLAEQMILLSGKMPGRDIRIEYTGLRPGEKLYEELFHEREKLISTKHEQILQAQYREMGWDLLLKKLKELQTASDEYNVGRLAEILNWFVPERNQQASVEHAPKGEVVAVTFK